MKNQYGFTLVEGLIVIVIIFILGGMLFAAAEPTAEIMDERDAVRRSEVVAILNAVLKYHSDYGVLPAGLDKDASKVQVLGTSATGCSLNCGATTATDTCLDLGADLVGGQYLDEIPIDPAFGSVLNTDYYINVNSGGHIIVGACDPENVKAISVTR